MNTELQLWENLPEQDEPYRLAIRSQERTVSKGPTQIDAQAHLDQVTADTSDAVRKSAQEKRHAKGFRTARENRGSGRWRQLREYGQLAVAAQRGRRDPESMRIDTAADGVITGTATINQDLITGGEAMSPSQSTTTVC